MKKKLLSAIFIITLVVSFCSCKTANDGVKYDIEGDIEYVKEIFKCANVETLESEHSNVVSSTEGLAIEGSFAGIDGVYEIELYKEGDNAIHEAGEIYSIRFCWDYNQNVPIKDIATAMTNYLGEPGYSDEEWGNYYWLATEMDGVTKFSNAPFGNCFDIDIYGSDCCICFSLSTTSNSLE